MIWFNHMHLITQTISNTIFWLIFTNHSHEGSKKGYESHIQCNCMIKWMSTAKAHANASHVKINPDGTREPAHCAGVLQQDGANLFLPSLCNICMIYRWQQKSRIIRFCCRAYFMGVGIFCSILMVHEVCFGVNHGQTTGIYAPQVGSYQVLISDPIMNWLFVTIKLNLLVKLAENRSGSGQLLKTNWWVCSFVTNSV